MLRPTIVVVLVIGLMAGCSSLRIRDPMKGFEDANRAYRQAISWSEYDVAATFLKSDDQDKLAADIGHLEKFRVTAYELRLLTVLEKDNRVRQIVKISYFKKDNLVVKSVADDQLWEYDPEIRSLGLPGGLKSMNVWVEFVIRQDGAVIAVKVQDTGDTALNVKIGEALRKWKFEPIQQDVTQTARLLYVIEAN